MRIPKLSLSGQVLVGLVLGIAAGIFFGESAAAVDFVGDAFIQLLRMTVIPYIAVSLVRAVSSVRARASAKRGFLRSSAPPPAPAKFW